MNTELADLIAEFWQSDLVVEATRAVLQAPEPEAAPWVRLLEGMVI